MNAAEITALRAELAPLMNLMITYADARVDRAMGFGVKDEAVTEAMKAFTNQLARAERVALKNSPEGTGA